MVNYYLASSTRNTTNMFNLEGLLGKNSKKLELLDELTFSFKNEEELKSFLITHGLLSINEVNKDLKIVFKNSGKIKKLPVFYSEHLKIKKSFDKIKNTIENREKNFDKYTSEEIKYNKLSNEFAEFKNLILNINFMNKLVNHYTNESIKYNKQGVNIDDLNMYLSDVRQNGGHPFLANYTYIALYELFKNAIYRKDPKTDKLKLNYRGYRDLINFIYNYKLEAGLIKNEVNKQLDIEDIEISITKDEPITKSEIIMYEDGFPPNSEELKKYKEYLENLPDECEFKRMK